MSCQEGMSLGDVADELGVPIQQLSGWRSQLGRQEDAKAANARLDALQDLRAKSKTLPVYKVRAELLMRVDG